MKPTVGRIVHYMLSESDAEQINRRRTDSSSIADRIQNTTWPTGAMAHIGNRADAGQVYPMLIVRVWGDHEQSAVNGKVELDGTDSFWATSRTQVDAESTDKQGHWFAPPRT